jgi:hypothetical protein
MCAKAIHVLGVRGITSGRQPKGENDREGLHRFQASHLRLRRAPREFV